MARKLKILWNFNDCHHSLSNFFVLTCVCKKRVYSIIQETHAELIAAVYQ